MNESLGLSLACGSESISFRQGRRVFLGSGLSAIVTQAAMSAADRTAFRLWFTFLADAPAQLLALSEALEKEDTVTGSRIAHSLRGAASNAGGEALIEMARSIESGLKAGELSEARRILPELSSKFSRLKPKLEAFIA
ncbi:MAG: Hpt domain-containing protein [Acidobacteria bacterium]|nr:Hpt domain-containing protein [Acidobacteriota bacterium]